MAPSVTASVRPVTTVTCQPRAATPESKASTASQPEARARRACHRRAVGLSLGPARRLMARTPTMSRPAPVESARSVTPSALTAGRP